jgi:rubredoxin
VNRHVLGTRQRHHANRQLLDRALAFAFKMKKYLCTACDYAYDPVFGDPDHGIDPGTAFTDLPDDWRCPVCGLSKQAFIPEGGG